MARFLDIQDSKFGGTMKVDSLTVAAAVFVVGLLMSMAGLGEWFSSEDAVPSDLQRGFTITKSP
jgi:hypothetical protein